MNRSWTSALKARGRITLSYSTGAPDLVSQEFEFFGLGKIQVQGQEGPGTSIAVIGGTGQFRNARGERRCVSQALCPDSPAPGNPGATLQLTIEFDLTVQTADF